jgi:hypothetical protein
MTKSKFNCPLCKSTLSEAKYYEVIRVADAQAKAQELIKKQLAEAHKKQKEILAKQKETLQRLEKEKREAIKDGILKGKQKEMARANKLAKLVEKQTGDLQHANKKIKELENHLKNGTTPQTAGLDFEKELVKQLAKEFPSDKIEHYGKGGDILHRVFYKSVEIGSIIYECKKTTKYSSDYVHQTKRAIAMRNASYGVLVTFASRKNSQGFFVDNNIIVVHPYGTIHIAQVLRNSLAEMHSLKLNQQQLEERSQQLMDFIKSDDFKNSVDNTIYRTQELAKILLDEHKEHMKIWQKRFQHYNGIHSNTNQIHMTTKNILSGVPVSKSLIQAEIKQLPAPDFK